MRGYTYRFLKYVRVSVPFMLACLSFAPPFLDDGVHPFEHCVFEHILPTVVFARYNRRVEIDGA